MIDVRVRLLYYIFLDNWPNAAWHDDEASKIWMNNYYDYCVRIMTANTTTDSALLLTAKKIVEDLLK